MDIYLGTITKKFNKYYKGHICMYSTPVYYYTPRQTVVVSHGNSARRYKTVYAKNIKLHKGVKNKIQFQFLNQEQKPIDLTGKEVSFRLISDDNTLVLLSKTISIDPSTGALPLTGIAVLEVSPGELNSITSQVGRYSLEWKDTGSIEAGYPVFADSDTTASGVVQIMDSIFPQFMPSQIVGIPSHQRPVGNVAVTFHSSVFQTFAESVMTMQTTYSNYTGTVQLQASTEVQGDWYPIDDASSYTATSDSIGYTIPAGAHPFYRVEFISTAGDVSQILVR
jgi:hypothetical protein